MLEGAWAEFPGHTQDEASYPLDREGIALSLLENAVLAAGMRASTTAEKETALRRLVAVRKARIARPESTVSGVSFVEQLDLPQELYEGTALYVELRFQREAELLDDAGTTAYVVDSLEYATKSDYQSFEDVRAEFAFGRFYATGSAIGSLLDAAGGIDWRSACKTAKAPFTSVVERFLDVTGAEADEKLAEAKSAFAWESLLQRADVLLAVPK
jgi:hypothetical protein